MANIADEEDPDSSKSFVLSHVVYVDTSVILADN